MEQAKLVGVGFMGRPDRVARLLNKVVANANQAYDIPIQGNLDNASLSEKRSITGFYFGFIKQTLNLSLYTTPFGRHPEKMNHRITYSMKHKKNSLN